ncbi:MAG: N-acetyltransferase [Gemmatimonadota bacterium]
MTGRSSGPPAFSIRPTQPSDATAIDRLYRLVAAPPGGLARDPDEITSDYIAAFVRHATTDGLGFLAVPADSADPSLAGELHCYPDGPRTFGHVLGNLTVAVHPAWQGKGVGRALFVALLEEVERNRPGVTRVELVARESNARAIGLYESLGFRREGCLEGRVRRPDGVIEADIPLAWHRSHP